MKQFDLDKLKFDANGLIPAIIQDATSLQVLMMAYMSKESLLKTEETGQTWFWSRSRQELWNKGATSGHIQEIVDMSYDCDADCLLFKVLQTGVACHTGQKSCFHNVVPVVKEQETEIEKETAIEKEISAQIMNELYQLIATRQKELPEGSYTTYLFTKGLDKILKKVGEEAAEVIIGAKNRNREEVIYESADLIYHLLVLLAEQGVQPQEVFAELDRRRS